MVEQIGGVGGIGIFSFFLLYYRLKTYTDKTIDEEVKEVKNFMTGELVKKVDKDTHIQCTLRQAEKSKQDREDFQRLYDQISTMKTDLTKLIISLRQ